MLFIKLLTMGRVKFDLSYNLSVGNFYFGVASSSLWMVMVEVMLY